MTTAIYTDESGGAAEQEPRFLVAALRIEDEVARRILKQFRRATGFNEPEIHGSKLWGAHRRVLVSMLAETRTATVSVVCERRDEIGGLLMSQQPEIRLWQAMTVEACAPLVTPDVHIIVPDGGRYPRPELNAAAGEMHTLLAPFGFTGRLRMGESTGTPGVQLADVVANIVYRARRGEPEGAAHVATLQAARQLNIREVEAPHLLPEWALRVLETRKAAPKDGLAVEHDAPPVIPPQ